MKLIFLTILSIPLFALKVVTLSSGGNLQTALTAAATWQDGTTCEDYLLVLDAGATFAGSFTIPSKTCKKYVRVRSSKLDELVPDTRVSSADVSKMATITNSSASDPTLVSGDGTAYWAFEGLEISTSSTPYSVIQIGTGVEDTEAKLNHHIIFDRIYGHGVTGLNGPIRIMYLNGRNLEVTNSDFREAKFGGSDAQAVFCNQCYGPVLIKNNMLSATGENFMSGGGGCNRDTVTGNYCVTPGVGNCAFANTQCNRIPGLSQAGIRVIGNHLWKDPAWSIDTFNTGVPTRACLVGEYYQNQSGGQWYRCTNAAGTWVTDSVPVAYTQNYTVKNSFEIKEARSTEVYGNVLENTWFWTSAPNHYAFIINQNGNKTINYDVQDIHVWGNRAVNTLGGFSIGNTNYVYPGNGTGGITVTRRIIVEHNVFDKLASISSLKAVAGNSAAGFGMAGPTSGSQLTDGVEDLRYDHNTLYSPAGGVYSVIFSGGSLYPQSYGTSAITNNVFTAPTTAYPWLFSGASFNVCTWLQGIPRSGATNIAAANVVSGSPDVGATCGASYPWYGNDWPADTASAAAITDILNDPASGDFSLKSSFTAGIGTATDGKDRGADWALVSAATAGAVSGAVNGFLDFRLRGEAPTSSGVVIQYTAPSTAACTVAISASPGLSSPIGSPTQVRVGKSGSVTLAGGLSASTPYYYGITCSSVQLRGQFWTNQ